MRCQRFLELLLVVPADRVVADERKRDAHHAETGQVVEGARVFVDVPDNEGRTGS
jgi:hypothetical protein